MKHMQTLLAQEPYEAPAILSIEPVTFVPVAGDSNPDDPGEPDPDDL